MSLRDASEVPAGLAGLSAAEARQRLGRYGPNQWVARDRFARGRELLRLLLDPMAVMLLTAAVIYFLLGETRDAAVLALALIPVLGIDVALEARSRSALDKLARAAAPIADVVREHQIQSVPFEEVVPGDILVLREGHALAADGVVRWAANLAADESSLTGESAPQSKRDWAADPDGAPDDARFFAGSQVLSGHGFGLVTSTGTATQYGGMAALVARTVEPASPLQHKVTVLVRGLGMVAVIIAAGVFTLGVQRGEPWTRALLGAVSLAMAAIPEEFPIVLTLFLSVGAWRLAARGMLVCRLASVETLGSTTVICTDKTGTLTRGEFQMTRHLVLADGVSDRDFLEMALLACEQHPTDAMEKAIVAYADARQVRAAEIVARHVLVRDYDFDAVGKHMSHVWRRTGGDEACVIASKGAVEGVLAHTTLEERRRQEVLDAHARLAVQGLRVLALAGRIAARPGADRDDDERGLVLYGLLGFEDPLRPEVPAAVADCQRAGIRIVMITGDHALTAHAVAEAAGIRHDEQSIVTGDELARLDPAARTARIRSASILARITPEQKHLIINALQRGGEVVAMTGDGVNDAPALHRADIGIAMGRRGTDVARATADLVLLDDNFASITETVRQGRHIFRNIQRAFLYLIAFHIPIIALAVAAPLLGIPLLLLPIHLVWLELIVHPVSAIVFQAEPPEADIMSGPPRNPAAPLLPREAVTRSSLSGSLLAAATLAIYWSQWRTAGEPQARGLALVALVAGYQVLVLAERLALPTGAMKMVPRTRVFWLAWCATALSLVALLYVPALSDLFSVERPAAAAAFAAALAGTLSVGWRLLRRRHDAHRAEGVSSPTATTALEATTGAGRTAGAVAAAQGQPAPDLTGPGVKGGMVGS
jgi:Ca2+-transporting ATPase